MLLYAGHFFLDKNIKITINKSDVYDAYRNGSHVPEWTFSAPENFRVSFVFAKFRFYGGSSYHSAMDIGDGLSREIETRLVHFSGLTLPSDVKSVSNSAWLKVYAPYTIPFQNLASFL